MSCTVIKNAQLSQFPLASSAKVQTSCNPIANHCPLIAVLYVLSIPQASNKTGAVQLYATPLVSIVAYTVVSAGHSIVGPTVSIIVTIAKAVSVNRLSAPTSITVCGPKSEQPHEVLSIVSVRLQLSLLALSTSAAVMFA